MPHVPDLHAHDTHDLELVAAFAAGDATGADLETALALTAGCAECAALHHDLRAIAVALSALPAPRRTRSFTLSPAQADRLRPSGVRRVAAWLASPRFGFAAPLGTGLATLGLAGLILATLPGALPLGGGTAATREAAPDDRYGAYGPVSPVPAYASAAASAAPSGQPIQVNGGGTSGQAVGSPAASPGNDIQGEIAPSAGDTKTFTSATDEAAALQVREEHDALVVVAGAAVIVGLALLALRWASRRVA